jgi:hypothetical protein
MCAIMPPECFRYDNVGLPVPSIEIKVCFVFLPVSFGGCFGRGEGEAGRDGVAADDFGSWIAVSLAQGSRLLGK